MVVNEGNSIDGNGLCEVRDSNERWKGLLPQKSFMTCQGKIDEYNSI